MAQSGSRGLRGPPTGLRAVANVYHEQQPLSSLAMSPQPLASETPATPPTLAPGTANDESLINGGSSVDAGGAGIARSAGVSSSVKVSMKFNIGSTSKNQWMADGQLLHPSSSTSPNRSTSTSAVVVGGFGKMGPAGMGGESGTANTLMSSATHQHTPFNPPPPSDPPPPPPPIPSTSSDPTLTQSAASSPSLPVSPSSRVPPVELPPSRSATPTTHTQGLSASASSSNSNGQQYWPGLPRENRSWRVVYDPLVEGKVGRSSSSASNGTAAKPGSKDLVFLRDGRDDTVGAEDGSLDVRMDQPQDPRMAKTESGRARAPKKPRATFYDLSYQWDDNSPFPEPAKLAASRAILVTSISHLTPTAHIKQHFSHIGAIEDFHIQLDPVTGAHLGICWVKFASGPASHLGLAEARASSSGGNPTLSNEGDDSKGVLAARNAVRQAARDSVKGTGMKIGVGSEARFVEVILDPEGKAYQQAVKTELARRRDRSNGASPARSGVSGESSPVARLNSSGSSPSTLPVNGSSHHPLPSSKSQPQDGLPPRPPGVTSQDASEPPAGDSSLPQSTSGRRDIEKRAGKSEKSQKRRRAEASELAPNAEFEPSLQATEKDETSLLGGPPKHSHPHANGFHKAGSFASPSPSPGSSRGRPSLPSQRAEEGSELPNNHSRHEGDGPRTPEMSATDITMMAISPRQSNFNPEEDAQRSRVLRELMMNGNEFMRIKSSSLPRSLKFGEAELKKWFEDAGVAGSIHKILHDNQGWYISFTNPDAARRCRLVLERRPFLHHPIALTIQSAPTTDALTSPVSSKKSPLSPKKIRAQPTSPTHATKRSSAPNGVGTHLSPPMKIENCIGEVRLTGPDIQVENLLVDPPPVDELLNELAFSKAPLAPQSNDVSAADLLASMAGMEEAAVPVPHVNGSELVKRKGASSSKSKPKAKAPRKRALKEDGVADGPPKKKARTSGKKSASGPAAVAMDVDKDLMDVIAADEDPNDELGLAVEVPTLDSRRASSQHRETSYDGHLDDEVLDLEAALIMGSEHPNKAGSSVTRVEEDLDVDAELLRAIGGEEDPSTPEVVDGPEVETTPSIAHDGPGLDRQPSTEPTTNGSSKRPRESSPPPPPVIPPETSEILSTGRVRKKTKTPYAMATEQLAELDALIPLPPPTKSRKKSGKGKNTAERDLAYHSSAKSKQGGHARPSKPKASKLAEAATPGPQATDDAVAKAVDESGLGESRLELDAPPPAVSTPPAPRPVAFRKPQRPRIPTLEEATPASPSLPEISELVTQSDIGPLSFEKNADGVSPDPLVLGLAIDDEELFFLKIGLAARRGEHGIPYVRREAPPPAVEANKSQLRIHRTGAARSEGYYKIPEALKSTYLPQRNRAMVLDEPNATRANAEAAGLVPAATAASASSRSNRINTRRLVQGMEQANKAMGDTQSTQLQFNQLRARKKQLIFARSPIHDWGLYAMEAIPQGEMVIEYVGEVIRAQVADKREKWYEKVGIGSSYLFRVDEDSVVDATKRGNLGYVDRLANFAFQRKTLNLTIDSFPSRLINHSCTPNCTAKIIVVNSQKKIVIYAKTSIEPGEEITYGKDTFLRYLACK
ncbi:histone methyltransferase set1 [Tulasnella sp. 424]|nr:histone methyltransferase set1 [Tulasnella sp. 424]